MKRLIAKACLEEIASVIAIAGKPLTRKTYLLARRWYCFQVSRLVKSGYRGKVPPRFVKHVPVARKVQGSQDAQCSPVEAEGVGSIEGE